MGCGTVTIVWIVVVVAIVIAAAYVVSRARRRSDGVDSFRRQIDALSPEARRTVVDQVQSVAETNDEPIEHDDADTPSSDQPSTDAPADEQTDES